MPDKITAPAIRARKGGAKIAVITAYDAPSARIADRAGADIILVGDSLGNAVLGYDDTLSVTVDIMVRHTAAVTRTKPNALVVGDMPWLSYHLSAADSVRNAARFIVEGGAGAIKLEGGRKRLPMVEAILAAEIPVMGHLGLTPQSVHAMGGFKVQAKLVDAARELIDDARALADAGAFAIVLEGIPDIVAEEVTRSVPIPTIGIGAGPHCDGQVLVFHDVVGLSTGTPPKFVRRYADLDREATAAVSRFFEDVRSGAFPSDAETYHMPDADAREFLAGRRV
ncbi:MAG TPA: 3-methyl-2-oxobutanoate hydroxymethyltransferase [Candidatus Eremiobacteraceae bacterium]|nr:3-methyl-2-oxobutanoate hydroxymethyltransferase [Candidatus Eremiobacteraceae bacterium]